MNLRDHPSLFFGDDKDIFDLIVSSKLKFRDDVLWRHALSVGLVLPASYSREQIASELAKIPHCWADLRKIVEASALATRAQRQVNEIITWDGALDLLLSLVTALGEERRATHNEKWSTSRSATRLEIHIRYTQLDFSRDRLQQRRELQCDVTFERQSSQYAVRRSDNERAEQIVRAISDKIREADSSAKRTSLSFAALDDAKARSRFFLLLTQSIEGFTSINITNVKVVPIAYTKETDASRLHEDKLVRPKVARDTEAKVRQLVIKGKSLLQSQIVKDLTASGHFIAGLAWVGTESKVGDGYRVDFKADLKDARKADGFVYSVSKPYREGSSDGARRGKDDRREPPSLHQLQRAVEAAATKCHDEVTRSAEDRSRSTEDRKSKHPTSKKRLA